MQSDPVPRIKKSQQYPPPFNSAPQEPQRSDATPIIDAIRKAELTSIQRPEVASMSIGRDATISPDSPHHIKHKSGMIFSPKSTQVDEGSRQILRVMEEARGGIGGYYYTFNFYIYI